MKLSLAPIALVCAYVFAAPGSETSTNKGKNVVAKFDDLPSISIISALNPIGNYNGLNWNDFGVYQASGLGTTSGVKAQSGKNVAANGLITSTIQNSSPFIKVATVKSFDLKSLYFACETNVAETPQQCTVAFTAYKKGSSVPVKTVNQQFTPDSPVASKMTQVKFPSQFKGLDRVDVAIVQSTTTAALTALLIDDVAYKTYSK